MVKNEIYPIDWAAFKMESFDVGERNYICIMHSMDGALLIRPTVRFYRLSFNSSTDSLIILYPRISNTPLVFSEIIK